MSNQIQPRHCSGNPSLRSTSEGTPYLRTSYYADPSYLVQVPALATF